MKKLFLRPVTLEDAECIRHWFNDTENVKYMSTYVRCKIHSKESVEDEIKDAKRCYEYLFMVCLEGEETPIGHAGVDCLDSHDRRAEIFYLIGDKKEQGKGYAKDTVKLLLAYAFNELKLNSLLATSAVNNKASIAILEKTGFKRIGVRREYNRIDGGFIDEVFFDITRRDYLAATAGKADRKL